MITYLQNKCIPELSLMNYSFQVKKGTSGQRLDVFLSSQMKDLSRNFIQARIKEGRVSINRKVIFKCSHVLKRGDTININIKEDKTKPYKFRPRNIPIDIVYQDKELLVVDKKAGVPIHPGSGNWNNSLMNGLVYKFRKLSKVGKPPRFGLIHRLDKDTSGVVMVALSEKALWYFSRQFEQREVDKFYLAVVRGNIASLFKKKKMLVISNYLSRHPKDRKKMSIASSRSGKLATTNFYFIERQPFYKTEEISLVLAKPKTGRTHQIRVHLASLGFPIMGDKLYGKSKFSRMLLHAYKIRCKMYDGKVKEFKSQIPQEFRELFEERKITAKI